VIDPHKVEEFHVVTNSRDPPGITAFPERTPVIHGISPELSRPAEVIRRHTGDKGRIALFIEFEQRWVPPHIGAVVVDIAGQISHDRDPEAVTVVLEGPPLAEEKILPELLLSHQEGDFLDVRPEGPDPPVVELPRPPGPGLPPKERFEGTKEGVFLEPVPFIPAEGLIIGSDAPPACRKPLPGLAEDFFLEGGNEPIIHATLRKAGRTGQIAPFQKTFFDKSLRTDEQGVPRKGRRTAVRGISR
jgi:hypothetical protein